MITRRALLGGAAAGVSGWVLGPGTSRAVDSDIMTPVRELRLSRWMIDSSLDPQGEFRAAATRFSTPVTAFDRDIGMLAMQIDANWSRERRAVAGITLPSGAFILERLALRHGMTFAMKVEHRRVGGGWRHELSIPAGKVGEAGRALSGRGWRDATVTALYESVARDSSATTNSVRLILSSPGAERWTGPEHVVSWSLQSIAPRASRL